MQSPMPVLWIVDGEDSPAQCS
uniref:Uncharacterized protein n=1 Tax=Anguilla anguilla TaxID=7936 RepID=A0A0E9S9Y6_ANGAN